MDEVRAARRDGGRVKRLRERVALFDSQSPNTSLEGTVYRETVALWTDVLEIGTRYAAPPGSDPVADANAQDTSFVSRMNQSNVDAAVDALVRVNQHEEGAVGGACWTALGTLRSELQTVASPTDGPLPKLFGPAGIPQELDTATHITVWSSRIALLSELLRTTAIVAGTDDEVAALGAKVKASATEAKAASDQLKVLREELREARAERARGKLATQFKALHKRESRTSSLFRGLAFLLLIGSGAGLLALSGSQAQGWEAAATHVAIATLVGGASAYAARLAAAHRGTADWAKAIQVQLETFQDFLGAVDHDETRHRVYEDFGRRVLGPPPVPGEDPGGVPTAQLIELLIASRRNS